jgi:EAL domain-containing protein (putative c-di-GMP-specific phosphodiesterase class I)
MASHTRDGAAVVIAAVDPIPPGEALLSAVFVAVARLHGTRAIDDVAEGPRSTAIVMVNEVAPSALSRTELENGIRAVLLERGHEATTVEVAIMGAGFAFGDEAADQWASLVSSATTVSSQQHSYRAAVRDLMKRQNLRTLFQPIVSLEAADVFAFEALSRGPANHPLEHADALLEAAARAEMGRGVNSTLAWLARLRAKQRIADNAALLFINLDADCFHPSASHIFDWEGDRFWPLDRLVVELTEREPIVDIGHFIELRDHARDHGVRFALDDAGAGHSGLGMLATLRPDFIKVDAGLIRGCENDQIKRSIIASLRYLAQQTGAELIAEGIETMAELSTLQDLGVDLVQGFLIAVPSEAPDVPEAVSWLTGRRVPNSRLIPNAAPALALV